MKPIVINYNNYYGFMDCKVYFKNKKDLNNESPYLIENKYGKYYIKCKSPGVYISHRLDGPASELNTGQKVWYYEDKWIDVKSQEEFENTTEYKEYIRLENLRAFE